MPIAITLEFIVFTIFNMVCSSLLIGKNHRTIGLFFILACCFGLIVATMDMDTAWNTEIFIFVIDIAGMIAMSMIEGNEGKPLVQFRGWKYGSN